MTNAEVARRVAVALDLLGPDGELEVLDSLAILDFATALEDETGCQVPTSELKAASFSSLAAVATLLARIGRSDR